MPRSYLIIRKGDFSVFQNPDLLKADAVIMDIYDAAAFFSENPESEMVFRDWKSRGIRIYLKLDMKNKKACYQALDHVRGIYTDGWVIAHASRKAINSLVMKAREYEMKQKMVFGTLHFLAVIDTPEGILNYRNIASYERIKAMIIDEKSYDDYLGLEYQTKNTFLRSQIALYAALSRKPWIDSPAASSDLMEDLETGRRLGANAKITDDISQTEAINQYYTPTENEIENAKVIFDAYENSSKKERKNLIVGSREISPYQIIRSQEILLRSQTLQLDLGKTAIQLGVKDEKIFDIASRIRPKKFYTIGEEIGNAITHGIGIAFSIVYLVFLILKGAASGSSQTMLAYIIYPLSSFVLYLASTLYHGLPLSSRAKRLFQKFDHMTIYLLIAGTYTPFTLLAIGGTLGTVLCAVLWVSAIIGLILNLFWFGRFRIFHMILYVALGWIAVFYLGTIIRSIGTVGTILLLAGGISYTLGILFYGLKLFKFTHMVWHIFVLAGTLLHFLAVFFYV
jgi:hemolysin III